MKFRRNAAIETVEPLVGVDGLQKTGRYRFQLVVTDNRGRVSQPAHIVIEVVRGEPPRR